MDPHQLFCKNQGKESCRLSYVRLCIVYMGDKFTTFFGPKGPSSNNVGVHIKITEKYYWVMSGLYINEISCLEIIDFY